MPNDLSSYWMPFTNNRHFKEGPRLLASADGMFFSDQSGRQILDATSGLWCVNAGHCRDEIVKAISCQARHLDYASSFQVGHPLPFELASTLADVLPTPLDRIFFSNSGSEAVDTALKIAFAYHRARGNGGKIRLIGRERGYHGVGFGGISVGGIGNNRRAFGPLLPGVDHIGHTLVPTQRYQRGQPPLGAELADELLEIIALHGAETIAAVIVEPMAGSTGVLPPPVGYLERLRNICRENDILLIFDEVITGFGRAGAMTASERIGVTPDIMALAKGLSNGSVPMGATAVATDIHDAIISSASPGIEFFHGYTSSGHPLAAAAALATLKLFEREQLCARAAYMEGVWEEAVHALGTLPGVIDVRNFGIAAGIELAPDTSPGLRASKVFERCFDQGVLIRTTGDTIALSPPLILETSHIDKIMETVGRAIRDVR
jgi:beta-alanine--pyruvate transaminase